MDITDMLDTTQPIPSQIKSQIEEFDEFIQKRFEEEGKLRFAEAVVIDGSGESTIIAIDMPPVKGEGRDVLGDAIRDASKSTGTQAVMFVSEIWSTDHESFMEHMNITLDDIDKDVSMDEAMGIVGQIILSMRALYVKLYGSMQKMPGAQEKVWYSLETMWGNWAKFVSINRDENGKPSLDPETNKWGRIKEGTGLSGRFSDLLGQAKEQN